MRLSDAVCRAASRAVGRLLIVLLGLGVVGGVPYYYLVLVPKTAAARERHAKHEAAAGQRREQEQERLRKHAAEEQERQQQEQDRKPERRTADYSKAARALPQQPHAAPSPHASDGSAGDLNDPQRYKASSGGSSDGAGIKIGLHEEVTVYAPSRLPHRFVPCAC